MPTKAEKKLIVRTLKTAKKFLWDGKDDRESMMGKGVKTEYICWAIEDNVVGARAIRLTKDIIESRLLPHCSLDGWLYAQLGCTNQRFESSQLQAHRHAWVDMLIKEFETK